MVSKEGAHLIASTSPLITEMQVRYSTGSEGRETHACSPLLWGKDQKEELNYTSQHRCKKLAEEE